MMVPRCDLLDYFSCRPVHLGDVVEDLGHIDKYGEDPFGDDHAGSSRWQQTAKGQGQQLPPLWLGHTSHPVQPDV